MFRNMGSPLKIVFKIQYFPGTLFYVFGNRHNLLYINQPVASKYILKNTYSKCQPLWNMFKICFGKPMSKQLETHWHCWQVDETSDIKVMYSKYPWGDMWDDGCVRSIIHYLRGSRLLVIPSDWKPLLPVEL